MRKPRHLTEAQKALVQSEINSLTVWARIERENAERYEKSGNAHGCLAAQAKAANHEHRAALLKRRYSL